jgi:hypothetical protein
MGQGLADIVNTLFGLLPFEFAIALLLLAAVLVFPGWVFSIRSKQIKGLVRRRVRATEEERAQLAAKAMELTAGKGDRLIVLARESLKMGQRDLWNTAMNALQLIPAHTTETKELLGAVSRERKALLHPLEVLMTVNRLRSLEMYEAALERVDEALERFPDDAELLSTRHEVLSSIQAAKNAQSVENMTGTTGL